MRLSIRVTASCLLAASLSFPASAEKIYKSKGRDGVLVFSDKPVVGGQILAVQQVEIANLGSGKTWVGLIFGHSNRKGDS